MPITAPCLVTVVMFSMERSSSMGSLELGHSEIQNLDAAVDRQKQIFRLQIAMHDEPFVRGGKALRDLQRVVCSFAHRDGPFDEALAQVLPSSSSETM